MPPKEDAKPKPPAVVPVHIDMPSDVFTEVSKLAIEAVEAHTLEKDQAQYIKKGLESMSGAVWHVIVGASFGASTSHENNMLALFKIKKSSFLVFQSWDETMLVRKGAAPTKMRTRTAQKGDDDDE